MRPVHATRQTRRRPELMNEEDHAIISQLRGRVPRHRPVLPAGRRRLPTEPAALGDGDLAAQDAGRQVRLDGDEDGPQVRGHRSRRRTGRANACRPSSSAARARSHWSPRSVVFRSDGRRTRSSSTAYRPPHSACWSPKRSVTGNWYPGSYWTAARCAGVRRGCKCTKSENSPISSGRANTQCPRG